MPPPSPQDLDAIKGKEFISWEEISEITGIGIGTLKLYARTKRSDGTSMLVPPEPDRKSPKGQYVWRTDRQDVIDWLTGKSRPGPGYRTDIHATPKRKPKRKD